MTLNAAVVTTWLLFWELAGVYCPWIFIYSHAAVCILSRHHGVGVSYEGHTHTALIISQTEMIPCHLKYICAHSGSLSSSLTDNWRLDFTLHGSWCTLDSSSETFLKPNFADRWWKKEDSWLELTKKNYNCTLGPDSGPCPVEDLRIKLLFFYLLGFLSVIAIDWPSGP